MNCEARPTSARPIWERSSDVSTGLTAYVGRKLEGFERVFTRDEISRFASAVGEQHPMYHNVEHARGMGFKDLPVPPTFLITLEIDQRDTLRFIRELGLDTATVLHGEQEFHFRSTVHAGDFVCVERRITGAGPKTQTLDYILTSNVFHRGNEVVATSECTWLVASRRERS